MRWNKKYWRSRNLLLTLPILFDDLSAEDLNKENVQKVIGKEKALGRNFISPWRKERLSLNKKHRGGLNIDLNKPTPKPLSLIIKNSSGCKDVPDPNPFLELVGTKELTLSDIDLSECKLVPTTPIDHIKLEAPSELSASMTLSEIDGAFSKIKLPLIKFKGDNEYLNGKKAHDAFQREFDKRGNPPLWSQEDIMDNWFNKPNNKIEYHIERYLTKLWNSLPEEDPIYQLGSEKFYELFSVFHPQALHIVDPHCKDPRSILLADIIFRDIYGDSYMEINPEKIEVIKEHDQYLKSISCNPEYLEDCSKSEVSCRKRVKKYIDKEETRTIPQDIIEAYYLFTHYADAYAGIVTKLHIKQYLIEHGGDKYKDPKYLDKGKKGAWSVHWRAAEKFVPITSAFVRGKAIPEPVDQDAVALRNGEPTNASGSPKG